MARLLGRVLLLSVRLALKLRAACYWALIYGCCGLCALLALFRLCWNVLMRPTATFRWTVRETPPPCLNDTSLGTHCFVKIKESGLRFHYVAAGERGKPLMLFLHGFPESWFSWRHQLREFKSEFRVVAVDMRGYGESDLPVSAECYQLDYLVTDIKDIVEYLGYNRCFLVGHDWGGIIAWLFAIHYPEMVVKLVVMNSPHPCVFADYALRHPSQMLKSSYFFFFQLPRFPELMLSINDFKAVKSLFTSRSTGIGLKGRWLTAEELEAYLYALSQPGALTAALNYYRNVFRCDTHIQHILGVGISRHLTIRSNYYSEGCDAIIKGLLMYLLLNVENFQERSHEKEKKNTENERNVCLIKQQLNSCNSGQISVRHKALSGC